RSVEARLDPRLIPLAVEEVDVDVGAVIEQEPDHADDARRPLRVAAQEAGEAGVEDGLAVERAASAASERGIAIQAARHLAIGARDARRVEIEALQGRIGGEERRSLAHVALAGGAHEQRRALASLELPHLHELLPARPARHAVLAGDHELGVVEGGVGDGAVTEAWVMRAEALRGAGLAAADGVQERAGLLAVELERRAGGIGRLGMDMASFAPARRPLAGR